MPEVRSPEHPFVDRLLRFFHMVCKHRHTSQIFPARGDETRMLTARASHYIVCFDCGKRVAYDWENMRRLD